MIKDTKISIIKDMDIMIIMVIILDILIKGVIFSIIYSSFIIVNIHIMIDYIEEVILDQVMPIIENMNIQGEIIGIKIIDIETRGK